MSYLGAYLRGLWSAIVEYFVLRAQIAKLKRELARLDAELKAVREMREQ